MDYTLRELECFTAVAEELSFTRAARRLHLAQPPLSRHIRVLEEKMGVRLFERDQHGVSLTTAGGLFYEETRGILPQLSRAGEAVRRAARGETARLRLGFVSAVLSAELVETFRKFRAAHAQVQVMLHDSPPAEQLQAITEGRLDGGFVGLMPEDHPAGVKFVPWRKEPLLCFLPAGHPLAKVKTNAKHVAQKKYHIALADLARESFIAVSAGAAPAFATHVHSLCREAGFRPRIVLESPRAQAVAVMVAAGSGVALLPESLAHLMGKAVSALPLKELPEITHVFAHGPGRMSGAMREFLDLLTADGC
ncbi:LysR substrate-binding domain-containing protein [Roseimicrobium sp. ORNL1]|uniref:LysR substrate-binding domain-containing protein n=1 Tax=Roseimicrobium sp. ORNL1 TaxID=2711231 RepID=UPI0013E14EA3|nr:LysR substrate-binding domain-containing protein [Roseimicrobium sp. ORNL1]QIF05132.1 LysR family transcriptional regulator [Roseimicrobium sp. ORNL1]